MPHRAQEAQKREQTQAIEALRQLIADIRFAMVTTLDANGSLRSRPLTTLDAPFDGTIWFMTAADSELAAEVRASPAVNLAYAAPDTQRYVSVVGEAQVLHDPARAKALWTPAARVWFEGPDDPALALLHVRVLHAEYWEAPSTRVGRAIAFAKAIATRDDSALGHHTVVTPAPATTPREHPDRIKATGGHPSAA